MSPAVSSREDNVYLAKLAEQVERYEEMGFIEKMANTVDVEERNLLTVAYKNVIGTRRGSWRIIFSIEQDESYDNKDHVAMIKHYHGQDRCSASPSPSSSSSPISSPHPLLLNPRYSSSR